MKKDKVRVLYIDDEQRNLSSFKRSFRRDYDVDIAISAHEGLELMKKNVYEIVLTDQRMPEITGVEFLTEISDLYPDSMRILITGYSDIGTVIEAINKGKVYKYINKPYEEQELKRIFEEASQVYQYRIESKENYKKYKEAFVNSSDPVFLINTRGEFIDVNQSCLDLLGLNRNELFDTPLSYFFLKKQQRKDFLYNLKEQNKVNDFEVIIKTREGEVDCLMSLKILQLGSDDSVAYQGSLKNITWLKKETTELISNIVERQESEKQRLANILHESLAQKLAGIKFYMSTLKDTDQSVQLENVINTTNAALDKAFEELREVCFTLVPKSLSVSLQNAIEELAKRLEESFYVNVSVDLLESYFVNEENRVKCFRAIQEILYYLVEEQSISAIDVKADSTKREIKITILNKLEDADEWLKMTRSKISNQGGELIVKQHEDKGVFRIHF